MTIGVDASRSVGRIRTGTENYSAHLIRALVNEPVTFRWRLYFNGNSTNLELPDPNNADIRDIPSHRLWTHLRLSRELLQNRVTGLFVPAHVVPLYHPPTVVTIHDLGYLHWPEAHPANQRRMLELTSRWSARVARHIIVPSQQTANDLIDSYKVPAEKISVIHHGVDPSMSDNTDDSDKLLRTRYRLPARFVLAVGTVQPRKNLDTLARAMAAIADREDVALVIAGRKGWMFEDVHKDLVSSGLGNRLHILDYVPAADLPALYRAAELFVQPSRFEGFGMPVLEAMACGTAVIAAKGSSLDEIGGGSAIHFDHASHEELAEVIDYLLNEKSSLAPIIARGLDWSSRFTWEQAARKTRIVLEENLCM